MSTIRLNVTAIEKATYVVVATFTDENGTEVAPKTLQWTLTDRKGRIINSRQNVVVGSPATGANNIVLSGNDLKLLNNDNRIRIITIEATYDSATYGSDLPIKESADFKIRDLVKVT